MFTQKVERDATSISQNTAGKKQCKTCVQNFWSAKEDWLVTHYIMVERLASSCRPYELYCWVSHSPGRASPGGKVRGESSRLTAPSPTPSLREHLLGLAYLVSPWSASGRRRGRNQILMFNGGKGRYINGAVERQQSSVRHSRTLAIHCIHTHY